VRQQITSAVETPHRYAIRMSGIAWITPASPAEVEMDAKTTRALQVPVCVSIEAGPRPVQKRPNSGFAVRSPLASLSNRYILDMQAI